MEHEEIMRALLQWMTGETGVVLSIEREGAEWQVTITRHGEQLGGAGALHLHRALQEAGEQAGAL